MGFLELKHLSFGYNKSDLILKEFSLKIKRGEIHCLLGPNGFGKSTLLHLIGGFLKADRGSIFLDKKMLTGASKSNNLKDKDKDFKFVPPEKRNIGMVFQEHCLFPNLNVEDNIKFGIQKVNKNTKNKMVEEMLSLVELAHKRKSYPDELSGGEQKRIAIARTLASQPKVILMDEPFVGLDEDAGTKLRREVKKIFKSLDMTALIVTHSQEEAFELGDTLTLLGSDGKYQTGSFKELLEFPKDPFFVHFLNSGFFINGSFDFKSKKVLTPWGPLCIQNEGAFGNQQSINVFIPSGSLFPSSGEDSLKATVMSKIPKKQGFLYEFHFKNMEGSPLLWESLERGQDLNIGDQMEFCLKDKKQKKWLAFPKV